jgi:hypothetical protein
MLRLLREFVLSSTVLFAIVFIICLLGVRLGFLPT